MNIKVLKLISKLNVAVIIILFINSCDQKGIKELSNSFNNTEASYEIDVTFTNSTIFKVSDVIEPLSFIKLETIKESIIGRIDKLLYDRGKIFIIDKEISHSIFIFDEEGNFLNKINQRGKGPKEFVEIRDVTLNTFTQRVCLLDLSGRKINYYSYEGEFIESDNLPFLFSEFSYIDSAFMTFHIATAYNREKPIINNHYLVNSDIKGNHINKFFEYNKAQENFTFFLPKHLMTFEEKTYFTPRFSSTIYLVEKQNVNPFIKLNFGGQGINEKERHNLTDKRFSELIKEVSYFNGEYIITKNAIFLKVMSPDEIIRLVYSFKNNKIMNLNKALISHPLEHFIDDQFFNYKEDKFLTLVEPLKIFSAAEMFDQILQGKGENYLKERVVDNIKEDDNPLLLIYKIKNF